MLLLKLDCSRQVKLDEFGYKRTYAGLLEGRPDAAYNAQILTRAINQRQNSYGDKAIHLIPPTVDERDPDHPELPPVLLYADLTCFDPIDPAFMGSALTIVWLTEECDTEPIGDVVARAVRGLAWEKLARDFDW